MNKFEQYFKSKFLFGWTNWFFLEKVQTKAIFQKSSFVTNQQNWSIFKSKWQYGTTKVNFCKSF